MSLRSDGLTFEEEYHSKRKSYQYYNGNTWRDITRCSTDPGNTCDITGGGGIDIETGSTIKFRVVGKDKPSGEDQYGAETDSYSIYSTVTFEAQGGINSTANQKVTYGKTYGTLPTPTKVGYRFNGWYTEASGGTEVTSSSKVTITSNQTIYAKWTANTYTVK